MNGKNMCAKLKLDFPGHLPKVTKIQSFVIFSITFSKYWKGVMRNPYWRDRVKGCIYSVYTHREIFSKSCKST